MIVDQAMGTSGVAALTAIVAKISAPTNERAIRWTASKRSDMVNSFDDRVPDHPAADIE